MTVRGLAAMLSLFVLNGWIASRMLRIEWFPYFHSVEGSLLGLQRYIAAHWGELSWPGGSRCRRF